MLPEKYTYFVVNFFTLIFPLLFSFTKWFDFKSTWKYYLPGNIIIAIIYLIWDIFYTYLGVWGFEFKFTLGLKIYNIPIDEVFFFICTPYACIFTYYCLKKFVFNKLKLDFSYLWIVSTIFYMLIAFLNFPKLYTSAAFFSCAIASIIAYYSKLISVVYFYIFYSIIVIPFIICNGILTGSFLNRTVVYYNDTENLGIRILTIPLDDVFYGMALILFHVLFYEYLIKRNGVNP